MTATLFGAIIRFRPKLIFEGIMRHFNGRNLAFAVAAACLIQANPLQAFSADGAGSLVLGFSDTLGRDIQSGTDGFAQYNDKDQGSTIFAGGALCGISDLLSLGLAGASGSGKISQTFSTPAPFKGDMEFEDSMASTTYGGILRLHSGFFSGESFKPGQNANPDGRLFWPMLQATYTSTRMTVDGRVSRSSGYWAGYPFNSKAETNSSMMNGSLLVPLQSWFSLGFSYWRELSSLSTYSTNGVKSSQDTYGGVETYSVKGFFYTGPFFDRPKDLHASYFPGIGFAGEPALSIGYRWGNNLSRGSQMGKSLDLGAALAFNPWIAANLGYSASQDASGPEDSIKGYVQSTRQPLSHQLTLSLQVSFGQNSWMAAN